MTRKMAPGRRSRCFWQITRKTDLEEQDKKYGNFLFSGNNDDKLKEEVMALLGGREEQGERRGERGEGRGEQGEGRGEQGEGSGEQAEGRGEHAEVELDHAVTLAATGKKIEELVKNSELSVINIDESLEYLEIALRTEEHPFQETFQSNDNFFVKAIDFGLANCRALLYTIPPASLPVLHRAAAGRAARRLHHALLRPAARQGAAGGHFRFIGEEHFSKEAVEGNTAGLKLRYDREVDRGEHSVLRRVLERDESAAVPMVLCVAEVRAAGLLLTDGWYSLPCLLERGSPLLRLVQRDLLPESAKLVTQGAQLLGGEAGCNPLEAEGQSLRLQANSSRRVRWGARLGQAAPITVPLGGLLAR